MSVSFTSGEDANNDCDIECLELKILEAKEQYNVSSWGRQEMVWSGEVYEITLQDMYDTYTWNPAYCDIVNTYRCVYTRTNFVNWNRVFNPVANMILCVPR